ncbi:MAG: FtsH protease activity modulator HflK [Methylobacteriaceae bacterium]|nr:FtsH protease activity modulator HflK [Methylobacteriaceae bacterium]
MPWNNQNGGGGGPWKPSNPGPWGQGPGGGGSGGGGGGGGPPDLEEFLRRGQERFKQAMPGGSLGAKGVAALALVGVLVWLLSGFYTVQTNEVGVNLRFGAYAGKTQPGLNYNFPYPIGSVVKLKVTDRNAIDVGARSLPASARTGAESMIDLPEESLMLTGDENIADVKFRVIWQIDPMKPEDFAFNIRNPQETVKAVAESAMREIVGRTQIQRILTAERKIIEPTVQELMQKVLNDYRAGVLVLQVQLLSVDPPAQVISAFRDVTAAQQDMQRLRNEAEAYANRVVPEARGAAARIQREAEAFRSQTVAEAKGQAARFMQVYNEYAKAPDVTRERLYLETMERVLGRMDKIILDNKAGSGVVPYLPLNELTAPKTAQPGQTQGTQR